jgi:hypothetical protein
MYPCVAVEFWLIGERIRMEGLMAGFQVVVDGKAPGTDS